VAAFHEWLERNRAALREAYETGTLVFVSPLAPGVVTPEALVPVLVERQRQHNKWGQQNHEDGTWSLILLEELGEFAKDCFEGKDIDDELVQVAAVALAWIDCRQRRRDE